MVDSLAGITIVSPLFACPVGFGLFAMKSAYINESMCADLLAVPILATVAHILGAMMECLVDHGCLTDHGGSLCVIYLSQFFWLCRGADFAPLLYTELVCMGYLWQF